jgi:hypothetical protein
MLWYGVLTDCLKRGCERIHIFPSDSRSTRPTGQSKELDELAADEQVSDSYETFTIRALAGGAWEDMMKPPQKMYDTFLQRLKVMASFNLARRPALEQGRFRLAVGNSVYEMDVTVRVRSDGAQEAMVDLSGPVKQPTHT